MVEIFARRREAEDPVALAGQLFVVQAQADDFCKAVVGWQVRFPAGHQIEHTAALGEQSLIELSDLLRRGAIDMRHHACHRVEAGVRLIARELGLPLPAYEQLLKASHTFNLLDARHAISVTERQRYILRVRTLARDVAQAYYERRESLGFPMLNEQEVAANG